MKTFIMLLAALLFAASAGLAQTDVRPPTVEFLCEPPLFFEFRWVDDSLYLSGTEALYRFRPADDQPPQEWRPFLNTQDFVYISPDADMIIAEDFDSVAGRLHIIRERWTGEPLGRLEIDAGMDIPLTGYSRDGRLAAVLLPETAAQRHSLHLYDLETEKRLWTADLDPVEGTLHSLTFSPDGRYLVVWGETSSVLLWDVERGAVISRIFGADEFDILRGVNFSPDGQFMYVVGFEQIFVWQRRADGHEAWERAAAYPISATFLHLLLSADGRTLVGIAYETDAIHVWDVDGMTITPDRVLTVEDGRWLVRQPVVSDDGQYLAAADPADNVIRIWHLVSA